jgi:SNF2 family DNA or RNA helicase
MSFKGTLYPFQLEAVERMTAQEKLLVAYEMGLGKSPISIAAVEQLIDEGKISAGFVICPNSLKYQWRRMIDQFTGEEANVIVVNGPPQKRLEQYADYQAGEAEYLILNYNQLVDDWEIIRKLPRDYIIADECAAIKNFKPRRSKRLKRLHATYQWGLTGQPIENRAEEVFSIMQWINPDVLGDFTTFDRAFVSRNHWGAVRSYKNLPTLHRLLSDHMVRRTREEVRDQLPAVMEESILVDFDPEGARLYRRMTQHLLRDLEEAIGTFGPTFSLFGFYSGDDSFHEVQGRIMSKLLCMRMLCDHPDLLRISAAHFRNTESRTRSGSVYADELDSSGALDRLKATPKLDASLELLGEILSANPKNKVVLFSYFKDMLRILQRVTAGMTNSVQFTGDMSAEERDKAKQIFTLDPKTRLMLLSDAGGVGLDLPIANYLISYDLPWSGGAWQQRKSRIIRLSSTFPEVVVISMLISDSVEERQFQMLEQKQKIADAVIDSRGINGKGRLNLDLVSLGTFLRESMV